MNSIYLDHAATTYVRPEVLAEMEPYFSSKYHNPSARYLKAFETSSLIRNGAKEIKRCFNTDEGSVIFTSGGTESDNLAVFGTYLNSGRNKCHIITSCIEHPAVLQSVKALEKKGVRVTYLPVDGEGYVNPDDVYKNITDDTILVSVMYANNETGVIEPIKEIASICNRKGVLMHTDAVQAAGHINIDLNDVKVDFLSASSHKFYGPKGSGFLWVRNEGSISPIIMGGGQQNGLRSGTENVPGIAGTVKALTLATAEMTSEIERISAMREYLASKILRGLKDVRVLGGERKVPGTVSFSFAGIEAEALIVNLDLKGIYVSGGSACSNIKGEPSYVLSAMGVSGDLIKGSVRFSIGMENTMEEMDYVANEIINEVTNLRSIRV